MYETISFSSNYSHIHVCPPLIALDAEISLNRMSTTFFSVTAVSSIKDFFRHLIVLTLSDFIRSAEHRKQKGFTSSVSIL